MSILLQLLSDHEKHEVRSLAQDVERLTGRRIKPSRLRVELATLQRVANIAHHTTQFGIFYRLRRANEVKQ